jgi:hypothetical protein
MYSRECILAGMHSLECISKIEDPNAALACVWILYLRVISRIFMHRMHSAKNLRCLVGILENVQILISRAEVRIQNILDFDSSFYF